MTALLALLLLLALIVLNLIMCIRAVISNKRLQGHSLLLSAALFLMATVLLSMFYPGTAEVVPSKRYATIFWQGFFEECLKAFCLLFFCEKALRTNELVKQLTLTNPVLSFALLIGLIENTRMFNEPLIATLIEVSDTPLTALNFHAVSAINFYTPMGIALLASTALPRVVLHFGFAWLFIYYWRSSKPFVSLLIAAVHGSFNVVLLQISVYSAVPVNNLVSMAALYLTFALLIWGAVVQTQRCARKIC